MSQSELIEELKGLICGACLDIALIQYDRERANHDKLIVLKAQKSLVKIKQSLAETIYHDEYLKLSESIDNSLQIISEKESKLSKQSTKFLKPGKSKIYGAISIEILKVIDVCEVNTIDLAWLKEYLKPNGELYKDILNVYPIESEIMLSIPSYVSNDKLWLHRLKETLQRSFFSGEGNVSKKKNAAFFKQRDEFYENIRSGNDELYVGYNLKRS